MCERVGTVGLLKLEWWGNGQVSILSCYTRTSFMHLQKKSYTSTYSHREIIIGHEGP